MKFIFLFSLLLLSNCTFYNEQFEEEASPGVGSRSLSQVNQMIDEGALPLNREQDKSDAVVSADKRPHLSIWMTSYTDEKGMLHKSSYHSAPIHKSGGQEMVKSIHSSVKKGKSR